MAPRRIDTRALIDESPYGSYQIWTFVLCCFALMVDGYDLQIVAVAAPGMMEELKLEPATLGVVLTAGQIGVMLGALILAPVADRAGRKWGMVTSCLMFGSFSLLTAFVSSVPALITLRVLAGMGIGGVGPAALAFGTEYAPKRFKASIPIWMWAALPVGGIICGFSAVWLLPLGGWRLLFVVAGGLPLVVAALLAAFLPESLVFLGARGADQARMRAIARRIAPSLRADALLYTSEKKRPGAPVKHLFTEGRAFGTVLLWILFFLNYGILVFFGSWGPTLIKMTAGSTTELGTSLAFWNIGSIVCSLFIGRIIDKIGYYSVLPWTFVLIALSMWAIGATLTAPFWLLLCAITVQGGSVGSTAAALMALGTNSYPAAVRSTAVGYAYAIGARGGAFLTPLAGGILLQMHWSPSAICYLAGAPLLLGAVALLLLRTQPHFRHGASEEPEPAPEPRAVAESPLRGG
jgi:AAHS family 4-hydroxybenzoate transporter-like MFS transporter